MKAYKYIQTPLGKYLLAENGKGITFLEHVALELDPRIEKGIAAGEMVEADTPLLLKGSDSCRSSSAGNVKNSIYLWMQPVRLSN